MSQETFTTLNGQLGAQTHQLLGSVSAHELVTALDRHQLLVFRDQQLDPESLVAAGERFGEVDEYPFATAIDGHPLVTEIRKEPNDAHNFGGAWHTDTSYLERPPAVTLLYALELPNRGGDTLFADAVAAFAALSPGLRTWLSDLRGVNTSAMVHSAQGRYTQVGGQQKDNTDPNDGLQPDGVREALHPLVRRHPHTSRQALYTCTVHTQHIEGMSDAESNGMLRYLHAHITRPEFTTRLCWRPGTLAVWDNRSVQHYPLNDYTERRVMHRVIVRGERPFG